MRFATLFRLCLCSIGHVDREVTAFGFHLRCLLFMCEVSLGHALETLRTLTASKPVEDLLKGLQLRR
jgi:hypothetical protein